MTSLPRVSNNTSLQWTHNTFFSHVPLYFFRKQEPYKGFSVILDARKTSTKRRLLEDIIEAMICFQVKLCLFIIICSTSYIRTTYSIMYNIKIEGFLIIIQWVISYTRWFCACPSFSVLMGEFRERKPTKYVFTDIKVLSFILFGILYNISGCLCFVYQYYSLCILCDCCLYQTSSLLRPNGFTLYV